MNATVIKKIKKLIILCPLITSFQIHLQIVWLLKARVNVKRGHSFNTSSKINLKLSWGASQISESMDTKIGFTLIL